LQEAYMRLERIEHSAAILIAARQIGELKRLPKSEFEKLCALGVCARQQGLHSAASEELPEELVRQVVEQVLKSLIVT
jgi:ribulose-5-phosphate 4-epimerase/fuculose-1-phosphate aldolase